MKNLILIIVLLVNLNAWEVNTHRAIERFAIPKSSNLNTFLTNSGIKNTNYRSEIFEGYTNIITRRPITYFDYLNKKYSNDGVSEWGQTFNGTRRDYQDLIESGSILEDAVYDTAPLSFNGRFNNHFYEAQNGGHALTFGYGIRVNALVWGTNGAHVGNFLRENKYSYLNTLNYFLKGFTEPNPTDRKKYQAKMLVGIGHLLHLMNDMTSPAHTRDDSHPLGDIMEVCGRGGESGNEHRGFRIEGNSIKDYLGILTSSGSISLPNIPKYSKFSDFISQESYWVSTHFFSNGTIFTKPKPAISDTYESFSNSIGGIDKYYLKSYGGNGISSGTKLAIKIKSYITRGLKRYYTGSSEHLVQDKSSTFRGDQTVLEENARILIPRAIANARNFLDYFFRGQIEAKIDGSNITIKNISDPNLVKDGHTATLRLGGSFSFKYTTRYDNTLRDFKFKRDWNRYVPNIESIGESILSVRTGFVPLISLAPGESIVVAIQRDTGILGKNIVVIYDGIIGDERGLAVCAAQTPSVMRN